MIELRRFRPILTQAANGLRLHTITTYSYFNFYWQVKPYKKIIGTLIVNKAIST